MCVCCAHIDKTAPRTPPPSSPHHPKGDNNNNDDNTRTEETLGWQQMTSGRVQECPIVNIDHQHPSPTPASPPPPSFHHHPTDNTADDVFSLVSVPACITLHYTSCPVVNGVLSYHRSSYPQSFAKSGQYSSIIVREWSNL